MKRYPHHFLLDSDRLRLFLLGNTHVTLDVRLASPWTIESGVSA